MMILVTGGSGSGKSAYAEQLITEYGDAARYYIATMMVWDDEGRKKVEKHRKMRARKQFLTVECQRDLQNLDLKKMETRNYFHEERKECDGQPEEKKAVLLECMSNLTANELFSDEGKDAITSGKLAEKTEDITGDKTAAGITDKIISGIRHLKTQADLLVIVTNDIFDDGIRYPEETREYQQLLGDINYRLAAMADKVVEVVYTIPVIHKDTKEKDQ